MYLKKMLSLSGVLTIATPCTFSLASCSFNQTKSIINTIDEISDLEIITNLEEENETVFNILQHPALGLAAVISEHERVDKIFEKELFKLDTENVYRDKNRIQRVIEKDKVIPNTIYYFQYMYKNKKNTVLVPVTIKNDTTSLVIKNIDKIADLEIITNLEEENETVFNVLNDANLGLAAVISEHERVDKIFEKELFKLDIENVFFDKDRFKRVGLEDKFIFNTTYYFKYFYNNKENNTLVPVKILISDKAIIKNIDKIADLEIVVDWNNKEETILNILDNPALGLAAVISEHERVDKIFEKELFKLDIENVFFDKDRFKRVGLEDKFISNTIYYFQYTYNNQRNNILVPVTIKDSVETLIVKNINKNSYKQDIFVNSTVDELKTKINSEFIKNQLDEELKKDFNSNFFKMKELIKDDKPLINEDLKNIGKKNLKIIYDYGLIKDQATNLIIDVNPSIQNIVDFLGSYSYDIEPDVRTVEGVIKYFETNSKWLIWRDIINWVFREYFKPEYLKVLKIIYENNGNEITDGDLDTVLPIWTFFECTYFDIDVSLHVRIIYR